MRKQEMRSSQPSKVEVKLIMDATVRGVSMKTGDTVMVTPERKAVMVHQGIVATTEGD